MKTTSRDLELTYQLKELVSLLKTSNVVPRLTTLLKLITTTNFSKDEKAKTGSTKEVQKIVMQEHPLALRGWPTLSAEAKLTSVGGGIS